MYLKRIEKLFPDVKSHNIVKKDSMLYVQLYTNAIWNENTVMAFQTEVLDRNPEGFGGPFNFTCEQQGEIFIVKWSCYDIAGY